MQLPEYTRYIGDMQDFFENARHTNPAFILLFVGVGLLLGWSLGVLLSGGLGKTEQRAVSQAYRTGYQRGYTEGRKDEKANTRYNPLPTDDFDTKRKHKAEPAR